MLLSFEGDVQPRRQAEISPMEPNRIARVDSVLAPRTPVAVGGFCISIEGNTMHGIIYLVGLVVVILALLSFLGLA